MEGNWVSNEFVAKHEKGPYVIEKQYDLSPNRKMAMWKKKSISHSSKSLEPTQRESPGNYYAPSRSPVAGKVCSKVPFGVD